MANFASMNRTEYYKVAGHIFSFTLPDSEKLWNEISGQYEPFRLDAEDLAKQAGSQGEDLLFSLEYVESLPEESRECVYDVPTEDGETVVKLFRQGSGWLFETAPDHRVSVAARILATEDFRHAKIQLTSHLLRNAVFGINNAAMLLFAFASAEADTLEMHASVIENSGKAYLFLGKSGTGKSTHSSLWLKYIEGSKLMNDDNPIVRALPDGSIVAYGSPWSGKTPCYKNVQAPVGAFVQIRQCPENRIFRMSVIESYSSLFSSISGIKDDDSSMADGLNTTIDKVLSAVPCYLLDCRPDEEAARLCAATVRH